MIRCKSLSLMTRSVHDISHWHGATQRLHFSERLWSKRSQISYINLNGWDIGKVYRTLAESLNFDHCWYGRRNGYILKSPSGGHTKPRLATFLLQNLLVYINILQHTKQSLHHNSLCSIEETCVNYDYTRPYEVPAHNEANSVWPWSCSYLADCWP